MAITPIDGNVPVSGVQKNQKPALEAKKTDGGSSSSVPQDIVEISKAAQQKVEESAKLKDQQEARATAAQVRGQLEQSDVSLSNGRVA